MPRTGSWRGRNLELEERSQRRRKKEGRPGRDVGNVLEGWEAGLRAGFLALLPWDNRVRLENSRTEGDPAHHVFRPFL